MTFNPKELNEVDTVSQTSSNPHFFGPISVSRGAETINGKRQKGNQKEIIIKEEELASRVHFAM